MVRGTALAVAMAASLFTMPYAAAADLPPSAKEALSELKLPPTYLDDIDRELAVPAAWIEGGQFRDLVAVRIHVCRGIELNQILSCRFDRYGCCFRPKGQLRVHLYRQRTPNCDVLLEGRKT